MDYRGTGGTQDPGGDLSTERLAADAVAVLDELKIKRAHVYGTSMGGRVAQVLAARHPARMLTLALACSSPGGLHAVERDNDVRKALACPVPATRQRTMVELFFTPDWGDDPAKSHLFGDPTMSTADRSRHLKMSARHDAWDLLPVHQLPDPGPARRTGPDDPGQQRRHHRRPHPRRAVSPAPVRQARVLRRVRC